MSVKQPARPLPLVITSGEPAGIGPDLCLKLAASGELGYATVLGDPAMFAVRARQLKLDIHIESGELSAPTAGRMHVTPAPLAQPCEPGKLEPGNAKAVLAMLDKAVSGCIEGRYAGMVTAPIHKGVINDAGISFSGHTEYLAERTGTVHVVMMLAGGGLRVALATTHLPLRAVPDAITPASLRETLRIIDSGLRERFGLPDPRLLVLGLNPHAGEGGHLGREEIDVIAPVIDALKTEGMNVAGPLPADTAFTPAVLAGFDVVVAMYHDQGLPVLKYAGFGHAVNVTLGLPIVRTSVDHGTALDRAGKGTADAGSLTAALALARRMADRT